MAALLSYLRYLEERKGFWLLATTMLGALSMLAKPMALSLPLILILLDWFKERPVKWQAFVEKLPLCVIIGSFTWISYAAHARIPGESVVQSALIWPWTFTFYLRQFLFPYFSVPLYRLPQPVVLTNPEYFLPLVVLVLVALALARLSVNQSLRKVGTVQDSARGAPRRNKWFVFAVLFYFLSIFFLLRFDETRDVNVVADRFIYLPCAGFLFLFGSFVQTLWSRGRGAGRGFLVVSFVVLSVVFSVKTFQQSRLWRNSISLWQHQLKIGRAKI